MNIQYLNLLPEIENKYNVTLSEGEKVVFAEMLNTFGNEKDQILGMKSPFTLTNKKIVMDNGVGTWTLNLDEISDMKKVTGGFLFFKYAYFLINLNTEFLYDNGNQKLTAFHLYFKDDIMNKFEEIMNNLLK